VRVFEDFLKKADEQNNKQGLCGRSDEHSVDKNRPADSGGMLALAGSGAANCPQWLHCQ